MSKDFKKSNTWHKNKQNDFIATKLEVKQYKELVGIENNLRWWKKKLVGDIESSKKNAENN
jgi:hypothetical protein